MKLSITSTSHLRSRRGVLLIVFSILLVSVVSVPCLAGYKEGLFLKKLYQSEVQTELDQLSFSSEVFTEAEVATLPEPVQRYFRFTGFLGQPHMANARIRFEDVDFVQGDKKIKLFSEQYNFVSEPARIAYLKSRLFGFIPFEGRDKYQGGQGYMTGKLMKVIKLFDVTGPEMNQSALVTFLAEILMVPSCALEEYIHWEAIDTYQARATMEYDGLKVSGVFTFDERGAFIRFVSDDRYMDKGNNLFEKERWTVEASDYVEREDGLRLPSRLIATWNLPEGDLVYFDGIIAELEYDFQ